MKVQTETLPVGPSQTGFFIIKSRTSGTKCFIMRPDLSRIGSFFHNYINQVTEDDIVIAFQKHSDELIQFLEVIPPEKYDHRYAEGKWTVKEVLQHIIDAERIFAYRSLRFARKDTTPLAGFDENFYTENAKADKRDWQTMLGEFKALRQS